MNGSWDTERLLRDAAPQVLAATVRRFGYFADAEDAVQEALIAQPPSGRRRACPTTPSAG